MYSHVMPSGVLLVIDGNAVDSLARLLVASEAGMARAGCPVAAADKPVDLRKAGQSAAAPLPSVVSVPQAG